MRELFVAFGGHAQAAGLTIKTENLAEFKTRFTDAAKNCPELAKDSPGKTKPILVDAVLDPKEVTIDFIKSVEAFGPYGIGFAKPRFIVSFDRVPNIDFLGS